MLLDLKRNERRPEGGKAHRRWAAENEAGLEGANRRFARGRQVQDGPNISQRSEKYYVYYFMQAKRLEETYGPIFFILKIQKEPRKIALGLEAE